MGRSKGWASVDEDGDKVRADSDVDLVRALLRQRAARDDARVVERLMHLIFTDTDRHFHPGTAELQPERPGLPWSRYRDV